MCKAKEHAHDERGFALLVIVFMGAILVITVLAIIANLPQSHKTSIIVEKSNKVLYIADSGVEAALAQLREDPNNLTTISEYKVDIGTYTVTLSETSPPPTRIVTATSVGTLVTKGSWDAPTQTIVAEIETDSPGEYFGASNSDLIIAGGTDISQGKIFAKNLIFQQSGDPITVQSATYTDSCNYFDAGFDQNHVQVTEANPDGNNEPWQGTAKTFPRLDDAKMAYYMNLANAGDGSGIITEDTFANATDIYPPTNGNHVYFCSGDMDIQGNLHGQIVFVSTGSITFMGNVTYGSVEDVDGNPLADPCTSAGFFSTEDVLIDSNAPDDLSINGQIIAPYGEFKAKPNENANNFNFSGSFIIKDGVSIAGVYTGARTYSFDSNLKNNPLPHLPYMANILSWKEE
ncbi:MAG: hypothetical protein ABH868_06300 [bacterium]